MDDIPPHRNFVRDLLFLGSHFNEMLLERNIAKGHDRMRLGFAPILLYMRDHPGAIAVDIAKKCDISKQAVAKTIKQLENLGYIRQEVSAEDGRHKTLSFTAKGRRLLADTDDAVVEIRAQLAELMGDNKTRDFLQTVFLLSDTLRSQRDKTARVDQ